MGRDMAELLRFSRHGGAHYAAGAVLSVHYYPGWASGAQRRCTLRAQRTNGALFAKASMPYNLQFSTTEAAQHRLNVIKQGSTNPETERLHNMLAWMPGSTHSDGAPPPPETQPPPSIISCRMT
ncbi:hypothetical protein T484DRAFT_1919147 [Baffinella frigidus]|nr:hypothetical protein T484DRAFT_1919147 [Cryptophyta sp. CCMP2293]